MKKSVTAAAFLCLLLAASVQAQPVRNGEDVIWARDIAGAQMTLDGRLTESVWPRAETIELVWDETECLPGCGQRTESAPTLAEPSDPNNGILYVLRDGNTLWLGAVVQDRSVGGARGLWGMDGLIMNILDRNRFINERKDASGVFTTNFFQGNRTEFFYSWWSGGANSDTTSATDTYSNGELVGSGRQIPGIPPRFHGFYGGPSALLERTPENVAIWDGVTVVNGIANDDTHGPDVGYTMEMRIDLGALGYDFTQEGGDKTALNIALNDQDYNWPSNPELSYLSRVWWQNQWGNNFNEGVGYIYGAPGVTVNSGALPQATEPEFTIPNGELFDAPTIDGDLDELVWDRVDPSFFIQYQPDQELIDQNPEVAKYYVFYFRPGVFGQSSALVVDPSIARVKMFFRDTKLYVGVDVEDQAINGIEAEGGRDGIRLFFRDRDSTTTQGTMFTKRFGFAVDSTGGVHYEYDAIPYSEDPTALRAAIGLKGASTPADPSDVDEGYQIEIEIDLEKALGYPAGLGDHMLWTAMNFFDGDFLEANENSYATRTWIIAERNPEGASIYGYLDADEVVGTSVDPVAELPEGIRLMGNYPNPFNPSTMLRYTLSRPGEVTVRIYDVLGRRLTALEAGVQTAGQQELRFDGAGLASGVYLYRIEVRDQVTGAAQISNVGRMLLVK